MPAPETIPVKLADEVAEYIEARPVLRQTLTLRQLVDLVLATTGKNAPRIAEVIRSGTCTYNRYRYWWQGFTLDDDTLARLLAGFPDPDPARPFDAAACAWVQFVSDEVPFPRTLLLEREQAARRRWFRRESFWDALLALARTRPPAYREYSYHHRGDLYTLSLDDRDLARLAAAAARLCPRSLRPPLGRARWQHLQLFCPR
jgi:hypothetical protein